MGAEPKVSSMLGRFSTTELHAHPLKKMLKIITCLFVHICTHIAQHTSEVNFQELVPFHLVGSRS